MKLYVKSSVLVYNERQERGGTLARLHQKYRNSLEMITKEELNQPFVLVVDMVNGFIKEGALSDLSILHIVDPIKDILSTVKDHLFICDSHDLNAKEFNAYPIHCVKETNESEVIDELLPYAKRRITKNSTNTFVAPAFQELLPELLEHHRDFMIVGCCSDICVLQLALSLNTYFNEKNLEEHRVIVPYEMIETYHNEGHNQETYNEFACRLMVSNGVHVAKVR